MKTFSLIFIGLALTLLINAQPGSLVNNFGDSGIVWEKNGPGHINKLVLQKSGKIIGGGSGVFNKVAPFLLIRYNTDGNIDSSFGINGIAGNNDLKEAFSIAIASNDDIIALGYNATDIKLTRYKQNGRLDSSFGRYGKVSTNLGANDYPSEVAVQPNGKIMVTGYTQKDFSLHKDGYLLRYLNSGNIDSSFGNNGRVTFASTDDGNTPLVRTLELQTDGKIIISVDENSGAIYRFNSNGGIDNSFGINGKAFINIPNSNFRIFQTNDLLVQPDGKIIAAGNLIRTNGTSFISAARLNSNGSTDSSFGQNGLQTVLFEDNYMLGKTVLLDKTGKIIISGFAYDKAGFLATTRLKKNGAIDSSFGNNGIVKIIVSTISEGNSSVLLKNGTFVLGGSTTTYVQKGNKQVLLVCYQNSANVHNYVIAKPYNKLTEIKFYPNPAKNNLHIEGLSSSNKTKLTVVDFEGNIKLNAVANNNAYNLNIASLKAGNYLLKIENGNIAITKKFMKE